MTRDGGMPAFAIRLRAHRHAADYSLDEVAHRLRRLSREADGVECGATGQLVWRWEHGQRPTPRYRRLLCALYDAPPDQLGFRDAATVATRNDGASLTSVGDEDVKRRRFLELLGAATLGTLEDRLEGVRRGFDLTLGQDVIERDVDEWQRARTPMVVRS